MVGTISLYHSGLSKREMRRSWYGRSLALMQTHTRSQKGHHPFVSRYSVSTGTRTRTGDADDDSSCSLEEENWTSRLSQEETSVTDSSDVALLAATEGRSVRVPHPNPNLPMRVRVRVTDPDPDPDDELELEARRTD